MAALETKARVPMQLLQDILDPALNEAIPIPRNASTCWKAASRQQQFRGLQMCTRPRITPGTNSYVLRLPMKGAIGILRWVRVAGFPWDDYAQKAAARGY